MSDPTTVKKLKNNQTECTVTFTPEQVQPAEEKALHELSRDIELPGFRKGNVPMDMAKEKINPSKLFELTIHHLLPETFEALVKEHDLKPVVHPYVEAMSKEPLTLKIVFTEKPEVKLKGINKIKIEKEEPKVDEKDKQRMIEFFLDKHKKVTEVDREAKTGDQITMNFWGEDESKTEIPGIRTEGHTVEIGSKHLIPGFEDELIGTKKGDEKAFTLTFPEKYHEESLQGKPITFHVTVTKIEEISRPELNDEFAKKELNVENVAEFEKQIVESMMQQELMLSQRKREQKLMDAIAEATIVELPAELIDDEARSIMQEFEQQLQKQGMGLDQWMEASGKKPEDVAKEMKQQGEDRLKLRLGIQQLVEEKGIEISDEEMAAIVEQFLAQATPEQRKEVEPAYQKGQHAYEQLKWQKKVEKVLEEMLQ